MSTDALADHLTCLLRNLYAGQEATVRTEHGTMDWLDLLAVQGTLKSLLQHCSSKHQFFTAQLSSQSNSQNFPEFVVIHTVKGFGIVNKAEIDVFLELSCFFNDLAEVSNLISGSSAFSKISLNIWKFKVHILLTPGLENFEH